MQRKHVGIHLLYSFLSVYARLSLLGFLSLAFALAIYLTASAPFQWQLFHS